MRRDLLWVVLNDIEAKELLKVAAAYEEPPMTKLHDYIQNELADFKKEYSLNEYEIIFNEMLVQIYIRYGISPISIIEVEEEIIRDSEYILYYGFPKEDEINCKRYSNCEETKKRLETLRKEIDKRKTGRR